MIGIRSFVPALVAVLTFSGCAGPGQQRSTLPLDSSHQPFALSPSFDNHVATGKIQHVIIIIQENRTFDNLFQAYPGADTVSSGLNSKGKSITLQPIPLERQYVLDHSATSLFAACDGTAPGQNCKMDAFDKVPAEGGPPNPEYVYVPQTETAPYFALAGNFVLADKMFMSHLDESFVAHQYLIAGQAARSVNLPNGLWGCDGGQLDTVQTLTADRSYGDSERACFDYKTLADLLDEKRLTWRFYTSPVFQGGGEWSAYQAVNHIRYGPDWANDVITPQSQFFNDVAAGHLANVTWITPTYDESDHVNTGGRLGPHWVSTLVNAVGQTDFWKTTAIFVTWDDWGGLYDHVPPPYKDYDGLGFRVPLLMISPYARQGKVTHREYEAGSILRFVEDQFGLAHLAASDTRANDPADDKDAFDFAQQPRAFAPVPTMYTPQFFMTRPFEARAPDDD